MTTLMPSSSLSPTVNKTASQLFNEAVKAYVGWTDPIPFIEQALQTEPSHLFTHVLRLALDLLGTGVKTSDESIVNQVNFIMNNNNNSSISSSLQSTNNDISSLFIQGVLQLAKGQMDQATVTFEQVISNSRLMMKNLNNGYSQNELFLDLLALKINHDSYFYLGRCQDMCNSIARVVDQIESVYGRIMYGYVLGMYAFGLEETNQYRRAEETGRAALEINKNDAWAVHAVTHVMEMEGRQEEGIEFLASREQDWNICGALACHNYWHWALHLIELGRHDEAIVLFDREVMRRCCQSGGMLDMVDGASLLFRIEFERPLEATEARWKDIQQLWQSHLNDHILAFNDAHMAMSYRDHPQIAHQFLESAEKYVAEQKKEAENVTSQQQQQKINVQVMEKVGLDVIRAMIAFNEQKYEQVIKLLYPIIVTDQSLILIGGSHAQRDVFHLTLINACLRASQYDLARELLTKRKNIKPSSGQTDRLIGHLDKFTSTN